VTPAPERPDPLREAWEAGVAACIDHGHFLAGLDVERLARAILAAKWYANDHIEDAHIAAGRIAREYVALSRQAEKETA
jgi:hypothetical protein